MLMNLWVSADRGAPPDSIKRTRPPNIALTFLKTRRFHNILSGPRAPNQLPFTADNLREYAKSKSTFDRPPFESTCEGNTRIYQVSVILQKGSHV